MAGALSRGDETPRYRRAAVVRAVHSPEVRVDDERGEEGRMVDDANRHVQGAGEAPTTIEEWGDFQ